MALHQPLRRLVRSAPLVLLALGVAGFVLSGGSLPHIHGPVVTVSTARADSFAAPRPRIFSSEWGSYGFKVLEPKFGAASKGLLFALAADGKEKTIWTAPLV